MVTQNVKKKFSWLYTDIKDWDLMGNLYYAALHACTIA